MDSNALLLRQVHPSFVQADNVSAQVFCASMHGLVVTSQVFRPTPKDENQLSVYNGHKFTPEGAFNHFVATKTNKSAGVLAVTILECNQESLSCFENNDPFDGHSVIDFRGLSNNQLERKAKALKKTAMNRGWLFRKQS